MENQYFDPFFWQGLFSQEIADLTGEVGNLDTALQSIQDETDTFRHHGARRQNDQTTCAEACALLRTSDGCMNHFTYWSDEIEELHKLAENTIKEAWLCTETVDRVAQYLRQNVSMRGDIQQSAGGWGVSLPPQTTLAHNLRALKNHRMRYKAAASTLIARVRVLGFKEHELTVISGAAANGTDCGVERDVHDNLRNILTRYEMFEIYALELYDGQLRQSEDLLVVLDEMVGGGSE